MNDFKPGDRVYVTDEGLAELRAIMRRATGQEPEPNHHGTINELWGDGVALIYFDNEHGPGVGMSAPYPFNEIRHLTGPEGGS